MEARLPLLPRCRGFTQQTRRAEEQVIEVQGFAVVQELFVRREDIGGAAPGFVQSRGAQFRPRPAVIFLLAGSAENIPRGQAVVIALRLGPCPPGRWELWSGSYKR